MHRLICPLVLACALALFLSSCGGAPAAQSPTTAPTTAAPTTAAPTTAAPIATLAPTAAPTEVPAAASTAAPDTLATAGKITDALGREVTIAAVPQRIVSIAPSITEILFAIGAAEQVVGVTEFCNYPPAADALPEIGGFTAKTISIEAVVALKPDLVIAGSTSQAAVVDTLEQLKIPVLLFDANSLEKVYSDIEQLGGITGHSSEAEEVTAGMRAKVAKVTELVASLPADQRPSVFYEVFDEPLITAGPLTFIGQLIDLAGATNTFADASEDYPQVSAEAIVARDPAVIVGPDTQASKLTPELIAARPGWATIRAVRDGRIYLLDGDIVSRPGPRLADALELLAAALYPDLFK